MHQDTILVADDDAAIRANLCLLLRAEGYATFWLHCTAFSGDRPNDGAL